MVIVQYTVTAAFVQVPCEHVRFLYIGNDKLNTSES